MSIEVFDGLYAARLWADTHADALIEAAILHQAVDWERRKTAWGVAIEISFENEKAWDAFRTSSQLQSILERTPDPRRGVLIYRGKSVDGGTSARRPKKPRRGAGGAANALPYETVPFLDPLAALFSDATADNRLLTRHR